MKILIVCSKNSGKIASFIVEQAESLVQLGHEVEYFAIQGKGIGGYLKNYRLLRKKIAEFKPDIIHAHYGLSGLLANLQRRVPVVTTYHGSDINNDRVFRLSKLAIQLSAFNVFVSEKNLEKVQSSTRANTRTPHASPFKKGRVIPCGVNVDLFVPMNKDEARIKSGLEKDTTYVLFAGAFDNKVKNAAPALSAILQMTNVQLLELKGFTRAEVVLLMNAVDAVLMTSFTEGSPQFIKEAMACNCPVVSVAVGDVLELIGSTEGCIICSYEADDIAAKLQSVFDAGKRTHGREVITTRGLDLVTVAKRIEEVYLGL